MTGPTVRPAGRGLGRPPNRADWLPLELCTGDTPDCPHYACPDGWHAGNAPNCSCTPDCALPAADDDDEAYDDGLVLIAGVLYDPETGDEA